MTDVKINTFRQEVDYGNGNATDNSKLAESGS